MSQQGTFPGATAAPAADEPETASPQDRDELRAIFNVPVNVQVVLGRTTMPVSQLLKLGRGAVVELNRKVGEAVDVYVNDRLIARGEVVIVDEGHLGVTMTEIVKSELGLI
ncbi:flagellar motor switch protein FliN [Niveispirillum irakense]|uniref:flagellar motor switch protein FliN n=1 Tax=Niveispirillum irakense TaxID=34011 RepID=UPI00041E5987|nr:flagellar motor switch protein FliN [Niveispirillum irakense]